MAGLNFAFTADNGNFMRALHEVTAGVRDASRQIEAEGGNIDRVISLIKGGVATLGIGLGFKELSGQIASTRGEFQQLEVAFKTMLGSEQEANKLMNQLVRTAAITPFDLQGVSNGAKSLMAYGIEADEVNDTLVRLGDIAAGLSIPLNDLVYLYGTTMVQGRMFTQDLRQFQGRGIPLADELAKQFGVAKDKVGELVTAGKVGAKEFKAAIEAMTSEGSQFGGLMEAQSQTISGQISNIEDALDVMFNEIGKSSEGLINTTLDVTGTIVENWQKVLLILGDIAAAYGAQKAILALDAGFTKAATNYGYDAEIAQLQALLPLKEEEQKTALQQAVAAGNLTEVKAAQIMALREEAQAQLEALTAKETAAKAEAAAAADKVDAIEKEILGIEDLKQSLLEQYTAAADAGDAEKAQAIATDIASAETWLKEEASAAATAAEEARAAATNATAASEARETLATQINTAQTAGNTAATGILTIAKEKLAVAIGKVNAAINANKFAIITGAIVAMGYAIYKLATYESDHEKAMKSATAAAEGQQASMREELSVLDDLNGRLAKAKKGSEEWKSAKEQVVSQFGKYFSGLDAEIEKTGTLASTYDRLTKAVRLSAAARAMEKYREDNDISEDVDSYLESVRKSLTNGVLVRGKDGKLRKTAVTGALRESIMQKTYEYIRTGDESIFDEKELGYLKKTGAFYRDPGFGRSQSATDRLRARFNTIRQGEALIAQRYGTSVDEIDGRTVAEEKENSTNLQTAYTEAAKRYSEAKKEKELMEKNRSAYSQAEWEAAQGELKSAKEEYEKLGGVTKEKKQTGPTAAQLEAKEENAEGKLADIMRKQAQERLRIEQEYEYQRWQSRIDLMQEGEAKVMAQQTLDFEKEKTQLRRRMEDELEAELNRQMAVFDARQNVLAAADRKYAKKTFRDSDIDESAMTAIKNRYAKLEEDLAKEQRKAEADRLKAAKESMDAYLREFGTYQQKREAMAADFDKRISEAANEGERMMLEAQKRRAQSDLDYEQWVDSGDIALAFGDISALSRQTIDRLIEDMERYRSKVVATFDPEKIAKYEEALSSLRNADIAGSFGMFAGSIPEYFIQRKSVGAQLDSAGENANALYEQRAALYNRVIDLQRRYNAAKAKGGDTAALEKELTSAKVELDANITATDKAVNAFRRLQEQWDALDSPEAKFTALATSVATVAGLVADLSGQMSEMADTLGDEGIGSALGNLGEAMGAVQGIADGFAKGGLVGGIAAASGAAMNLVTKLAMAGDARHQRTIERLQERIEELRKSYDRLGKAVDKAYSSDAARLIEQQEANLVRQRALVAQQLAEEEAKKKTDSDRVRQYRDQLEELDEQIAETKERAKDAIFGDDVKSQIESFAEAYSSAWESGESRVMSARDTVRKMMRQMVEESIKAAIEGSGAMDRIRQNLLDFYADGVLTSSEQNYIYGLADELQKELDARFGQQSDLLRGDTLNPESTKGRGWETFSQESADLLNGRFAAFCETSEAIREINAGIAESVRQGLVNAVEQRDLMRESLNIQIASMGHLEAISRNTRELATIREDLSKIERHVRNNL